MDERESGLVSGVAWYRREQWPLLRENSADAEDLEETYDEWLEFAKDALLNFARKGSPMRRIDVDVEELIAWCREENRPLDANARAAFASEKLHRERQADGEQTV